MAASGYSPISLYYSTTASATPTNTNLVNGELALNITDGKLFYKDNAGTVQTLATKAATSGSFSTTTISTSETLSYGTANGVAYLNGSKVVTTGSALTFDGTTVSSPVVQSTNGTITTVLSYSGGNSTGVIGTTSNHSVEFRQNNTEQMRLTSTGLGIGTSSPAYKLDVVGPVQSSAGYYINGNTSGGYIWVRDNYALRFGTNDTERMRLDSSGNLGLGVTPSASTIAQFEGGSNLLLVGRGNSYFSNNATFNSAFKYINTAAAGQYLISGSSHYWYTAPSGTAGNAITFTQAMTLDASANLQLNTTTSKVTQFGGSATGMTIGSATYPVLSLWDTGDASWNFCLAQDGGTAYLYNNANGPMLFYTNATERARIDSSGNLGIGTSSPAYRLDVLQAGATTISSSFAMARITGANATANDLQLIGPNTSQVRLNFGDTDSSNVGEVGYDHSANSMRFVTNGSERAKIDSSGNLLVGSTYGGGVGIYFANTDGVNSRSGQAAGSSRSLYTGYYSATSTTQGTLSFNVTTNGNVTNTNNSYGAISDIKLKENIVDATPKLEKLCQVRVVNYNFKEGQTHKQIGVIAQELEQVFPSMIEEVPDRDAEGNDIGTTTKQVKYSVFVPMLIKALQEMKAIIDDQAARIAALEAK